MDSTTVAEDSGLNVTKEGYLGRFFVNSNGKFESLQLDCYYMYVCS